MAIISKPVRLYCSCYELGHCWTPHCVKASTDVAKDVFSEAIKIYGALYLLTALFKRKGWKYYAKKFVPETLRSTLFLTVNGSLFVGLFCVTRKLKGYYSFYDTFVCGIPACVVSLLIEQKHRRGPLAIYITNLAVETGFRMLINRGIVRPIKNGEVMLFSVVSAVYLYLFRKKDGLPKSTLSVFKFLVGADENPDSTAKDANDNSTTSTTTTETTTTLSTTSTTTSVSTPTNPATSTTATSSSSSSVTGSKHSLLNVLLSTPGVQTLIEVVGPHWRRLVTSLKASPKHRSCPHSHGCLHYVLKGLCKMFGLGYVVQLLIKLISSISAIRRRPSEVTKVFWGRDSFGLAAFLSLYSVVFRGVNCTLRWLRQKDEAIHGMVAGFLAGGAMYFYNSLTVSLFCAAKLVELLYFKGIEAGRLPYIRHADIFIYAFSCAFVFHAAVLEPHALRPAYWKWLLRVTRNKFSNMNRRLLDVFGTESSKMFPYFWPKYDPRYTNMIHPPS
ncbi:transmembrane protein 135-like isoform X2 [Littorina saxatilis]|uniref:transmembrane protein 135-like isoform X2 n=1 Tax=Littorina saxatilis TaxID=31220 RepID=UPI0038B43B49